MNGQPNQCRGGCGTVFRNHRREALCAPCSARLEDGIAQMPLIANSADPVLARRNRVNVDRLTRQAILAGDFEEAARRVRHRAMFGLYSDPGPKPAPVAV